MKKYIEREAAVSMAHGYCHTKDGRCCGPDDVVELYEELKAIPAADVVEVVRCRDCDIGTCYSDDSVQCEWSNGFYADDYCPRGKRKGGDE